MQDTKKRLLDKICKENGLEPKRSTICSFDCKFEPPALVNKCPCEDYVQSTELIYPKYNNLPIERLIELIINITSYNVEISKEDKFHVKLTCYNDIMYESNDYDTIELCLLNILSELNIGTYIDEIFYLK